MTTKLIVLGTGDVIHEDLVDSIKPTFTFREKARLTIPQDANPNSFMLEVLRKVTVDYQLMRKGAKEPVNLSSFTIELPSRVEPLFRSALFVEQGEEVQEEIQKLVSKIVGGMVKLRAPVLHTIGQNGEAPAQTTPPVDETVVEKIKRRSERLVTAVAEFKRKKEHDSTIEAMTYIKHTGGGDGQFLIQVQELSSFMLGRGDLPVLTLFEEEARVAA